MRSLDRIFRRNKPNLKTLAQWVKSLFSTGVNGAWYDPSDINLTWRRNLLTYTEQFDNAAWTKVQTSVTANATTAPDGTATADLVIPSTASAQHYFKCDVAETAGNIYICSFYAKASGYRFLRLGPSNMVVSVDTCFDLQTGTISVSNAPTSASITSVGDGWYKCTLTFTANITLTGGLFFSINNMSSTATTTYSGDGTSGIYIWGAQLELGSTATPYQRITDGIKDYLDYKPLPILYQDAAGTKPVTAVGQPVGLMLDKSKGLVLGSEQVYTNSISGLPAGGGTRFYPVNMQNAVGGKAYKITFTITNYSGTGYVGLAGAAPAGVTQLQYLGNGTFSCIQFPTGSGVINFFTLNTNTADFSNISVRELPGNHAFNPTPVGTANFPVLSAKYNLLTKTEDFSDAAWERGANVSVTQNTLEVTDPKGTYTSAKFNSAGTSGAAFVRQVFTIPLIAHTGRVWVRKGNYRYFGLRVVNNDPSPGDYVVLDFDANGGNGGIAFVPASENVSYSFTKLGEWFEFTVTNLPNASQRYFQIGISDAYGIEAPTVPANSFVYVWHPDLRVSNDALNQPSYQRVNTDTDYDTVGFKPYLSFNGVNQWLQTNSIDFTYGDKMFVSAGVRKLSDGTASIMETSSDAGANLGSMFLYVNNDTITSKYRWLSRGTNIAATSGADNNPAPRTDVISGIGNISGDQAVLRINGTQAAINTADQGTGNYGNYPLYIGARAGSSLWFNGRLYGLVVAGKQASASEITSCERYLNQKTGAY